EPLTNPKLYTCPIIIIIINKSSGQLNRSMAASSSRGPVSSSPFSSSSSSSSFKQSVPQSSASTFYGASGNGYGYRSDTNLGLNTSDSMYSRGGGGGYGGLSPVGYPDEMIDEAVDDVVPRSGGGDSISVTIRFRPLSEREYQRGDEVAWYADGDKLVRNEYNPATSYAFDKVFGSYAETQEVYEVAAAPVIRAAMEGINGGIELDHNVVVGANFLNNEHLVYTFQTPGREFLLRVSYIEIYNEVINDLLDPTGQNLRVREDAQGTYVEGIKEEVVLSPGHALSFIAAGEEHRHIGSNNFNLLSSRSHTIFTLMIESSSHGDEYDGVIFSQLNLIDLAGSESSKTETTGLRRKEGSYINKSLLTLGTVIGKLSEGRASHIPYRDSKLTRILQSSLSGHGHVSLICTITPASSSMEETHNTLKFASRAKRIEIYASQNKIIDEKSLIKKYQREISALKLELDQLRRGMLVGVNPEEIMSLKQKLEEGQVKMQSRLEEEEEAKAALMSRIQRLTKLILVSSKDTIPANDDDNGSLLLQSDLQNDLVSGDLSAAGSTITDSNHAGEVISRAGSGVKRITGGLSIDEMDLLVERVKMLAGEIAFSTSTLKRLVEQSANDPESSKTQIENLEHEIEEKRKQMRALEKQIVESNEASISNTSLSDMQQTMMKLMTQCDEKGFELELKTADNRILQEELQNKCAENKELHERIMLLEQQLSMANEKSKASSEHHGSKEYIDGLRTKIKIQEVENEKLKLERVQILEENSGLYVQNQKLSEEASYAKELASAAAVELKNLAGEVTKLSLENAKLEKELVAACEMANSKSANGGNRKYDPVKPGRKGRSSSRVKDAYDEFDSWSLDVEDLRMELQARRQREAKLEAALSEKELIEEEYRKKVEESKKKEASLENDLANMWVLVAQLKKEAKGSVTVPESNNNENHPERSENVNTLKVENGDGNNSVVKESRILSVSQTTQNVTKEEPLVARLKARMQEMKEKEVNYVGNGDANSHCVNLVHLHVPNVQFAEPRSRIEFDTYAKNEKKKKR
ncbi:hypothetical protein M8C21_008206, partial [Ambrosia artemisiifolia]